MPKAPLASATLLPAVLPHAPGEGHHSWKMPFRFICKIQKQRGLLPLLEEHCKSRAKCLLMERMPKLKRCNIRVVKLLHYRSSTAQTTGEDFSQGDGEDLSLSCLPMTLTCCMQLPHLLPRSLLHRHNFWWRKQSRPSLPQLLVSLLLSILRRRCAPFQLATAAARYSVSGQPLAALCYSCGSLVMNTTPR